MWGSDAAAFWSKRANHIRLSEGCDQLQYPTVAPGAGDPRPLGTPGQSAASAPLRILFCAWRDLANPLAGGSEVLVDRLASGLTAHGHDVSLLCAGPVGHRDYEVVPCGSTYTQYALAPLHYLAKF